MTNITDIAREVGIKFEEYYETFPLVARAVTVPQLERFATAIKAAILAELLAGVEMPEPVGEVLPNWSTEKERIEGVRVHLYKSIAVAEKLVTLDQLREYAAGQVLKAVAAERERDAALDECVKALTVDASGKRVYPQSRMKALSMIEALEQK